MKRLALALCLAVLAVSACARPVLQTASPAVCSGWTLVEESDWRTRAPGLIGKCVELHGNLSTQFYVDPGSSLSNTGWMRGTNYRFGQDFLATLSFAQISNEQAGWFRTNKCLETCVGVFVRGVVVIVGAGPVLEMIDISFKSRAGRVAAAATLAVPALNAQEAPAARTGTSAAADTGWTLVPASDWRTRARGLVGQRIEVAGDLSILPPTFLGVMRSDRRGFGEASDTIRGHIL